ncbi:MAG: hypothetical protein ABNH26_04215 [Celeribacter sp.]
MAFLPEHQRDTYSDNDIQQLCEIAGAPSEVGPKLKTALEDVAANYRRMSDSKELRATNKAKSRELSSIAKRAAQLARQIEGMSHEAHTAFERQITEDETKVLLGQSTGPSLVLSDDVSGGETRALALEPRNIVNILRGIENTAARGTERSSQRKSGRPFDMALNVWMSSISSIWDDFSTLPFSRYVTDQSDPVSPAARFCALAFKRLSPQTPTSRVMLAMKERVTSRRAKQSKT